MKEIRVAIDTEEVQRYLYINLIKRGMSPSNDELEVVADILFDFLVHKQIIEEELD